MTCGQTARRRGAPAALAPHPSALPHLGVGDGLQQRALGKAEVVRGAILLHQVHPAPEAAALQPELWGGNVGLCTPKLRAAVARSKASGPRLEQLTVRAPFASMTP